MSDQKTENAPNQQEDLKVDVKDLEQIGSRALEAGEVVKSDVKGMKLRIVDGAVTDEDTYQRMLEDGTLRN